MDPGAAMLPARAAGQMGQQIVQSSGQVGNALINVADIKFERKQREGAEAALAEANLLERESEEFLLKNQHSLTIAEDYDDWAKKRHDAVANKFPTSQAAKLYKSYHDRITTSKWSEALKRGDLNSQAKFSATLNETAQTITSGLSTQTMGPVEAFAFFQQAYTTIDATQKSPAIRQAMKADLMEKVVIGASLTDPGLARKILESQTDVDPILKRSLLRQVETNQATLTGEQQFNFKKQVKNQIHSSLQTGIPISIDPSIIRSVLGSDSAETASLLNEIDEANTTIDIWKSVSEDKPSVQGAKLSTLKGKLPEGVDLMLNQKLTESENLWKSNPAEWVKQNDKKVADAFDIANQPNADKGFKTYANNLLIDGQKGRGLAIHQLRLMDSEAAKASGAKLMASGPTGITQFIDEMVAEYPDYEQRAMAWNDLVTMGNVSPAMQFLGAIPDRRIREQAAAIFASAKEVAKLSTEDRSKFDKELVGQNAWRQLKTIIEPNVALQRGAMTVAFEDSLLTYAQRLTQPTAANEAGMSVKAAVHKAVEDLVSGSWHIGRDGNGNSIAISLMKSDDGRVPPRTKDEAQSIIDSLDFVRKSFPVDKVKTVNALGQPVFPTAEAFTDKTKRLNEIQSVIWKNGMWFQNPDGNGATLHVKDSKSGDVIPLYDEKGKQWEILYSDLPYAFTLSEQMVSAGPGGTPSRVVRREGLVVEPVLQNVAEPFSMENWRKFNKEQKMVGFERLAYPLARPFMKTEEKINMPKTEPYWRNLRTEAKRDFNTD